MGPRSVQGDNDRYRLGVAWLVRNRVDHAFCEKISINATQGISIWVHGTCLVNLYVPPGHDAVATAALTTFWEQNRIQEKNGLFLVTSIMTLPKVHLVNGCSSGGLLFSPISPRAAVDGRAIGLLIGL